MRAHRTKRAFACVAAGFLLAGGTAIGVAGTAAAAAPPRRPSRLRAARGTAAGTTVTTTGTRDIGTATRTGTTADLPAVRRLRRRVRLRPHARLQVDAEASCGPQRPSDIYAPECFTDMRSLYVRLVRLQGPRDRSR
ncbi:hypothetical protein FNV65_46225 [Streptomyces sp. S1A1-8]|nr:hypothetical protein FNV65_46225 [Streptomyces sp. S1A1-8]